jgi:hypothetical protein
MFKSQALELAIEIAKEAARGGNTVNPDFIIQNAYDKIITIDKENDNLQEG